MILILSVISNRIRNVGFIFFFKKNIYKPILVDDGFFVTEFYSLKWNFVVMSLSLILSLEFSKSIRGFVWLTMTNSSKYDVEVDRMRAFAIIVISTTKWKWRDDWNEISLHPTRVTSLQMSLRHWLRGLLQRTTRYISEIIVQNPRDRLFNASHSRSNERG